MSDMTATDDEEDRRLSVANYIQYISSKPIIKEFTQILPGHLFRQQPLLIFVQPAYFPTLLQVTPNSKYQTFLLLSEQAFYRTDALHVAQPTALKGYSNRLECILCSAYITVPSLTALFCKDFFGLA